MKNAQRLKLLFLIFFILGSWQSFAQSLKVLSFNTMLLPWPLSWSSQGARSLEIAKKLKVIDADVILLQEVFIKSSRKKIAKYLKNEYPYQTYLPKKEGGLYILSSGLVILSKHPFKKLSSLYFKHYNKTSSDRFASKGALAVELDLENAPISLILTNTHLQSSNDEKNFQIRLKQLAEINQHLETFIRDAKKPFHRFIIGDTNIDGHEEKSIEILTTTFPNYEVHPLLETSPKYSHGHDASCSMPLIRSFDKTFISWLDHIWSLDKNNSITVQDTRIYPILGNIRKKPCILSDHHALLTTINITTANN
jgi:endonuclease/exonuclease/phosphatase family metal-dependent hydrolase